VRCVAAAVGAALAVQLAMASPAARGVEASADTLALSLDESVRLALEKNKDVMLAREKVSEASGGVGEASTAFLPRLTGSVSYTRLDMAPFIPTSRLRFLEIGSLPPSGSFPREITLGLPDNYATQIRLDQPVFTGGKIASSYELARSARSSAEKELDLAMSELVFETTKAYVECVTAERLERVAEETATRFEAHLRDVEAMFETGVAAKNDVLKTEVYYSDSRLALVRARHSVRLAKDYLATVIGEPLSTEIVFTSRADTVTSTSIDLHSAIATGLARRAELASIEFRQRMARNEITIGRSGYLPEVHFFANVAYQYPDREYARDFYSSWSMGVLAQMNVFDWGRTAYRVRQFESRLKQLEIAERKLRETITLDVTRSYLTLLDAREELEVSRQSVAEAEENFRVTRERFEEGLATNTDLLDAEVLLSTAHTKHRNLIGACLIAEADLVRATGGTERR
jgi:outer membrane protein